MYEILYAFQQCKHFGNRLRNDKVTESLKVGTSFETQCIVSTKHNNIITVTLLWLSMHMHSRPLCFTCVLSCISIVH